MSTHIKHGPLQPRRPSADAIASLDSHYQQRRERSLRSCHRPAHVWHPKAHRQHSNAFVPQCSARILNDPNLTDGARRCAAKLMELAYRRDRRSRAFNGTVLYLAKCLGRSERAIQYYLAQLRAEGYIRHEVVRSARARMCIGIIVTLLEPLFPAHHRAAWPESAGNSGVQKHSEKYRQKQKHRRFEERLEVDHWARKCMDGVFRALMKSEWRPNACLKTGGGG